MNSSVWRLDLENIRLLNGGCKYKYSHVYYCTITVYSLSDIHGNIFYIGSTINNLSKRLYEHLARAANKPDNQPRVNTVIVENDFNILINPIKKVFVSFGRYTQATSKSRTYEGEILNKLLSDGHMLTNQQPIITINHD